ncbi:tRNA (adenosine(37)-N6)-threonylcarbamoyltransferase complex dimerization subunit type 1 TsaB [Patescibacteria group bacterium]
MILSIDTISNTPQLALYEKSLSKVPFSGPRSYSQEIVKHLDALLRRGKTTLQNIDQIVVLTGPGSFTSIRIGISFANALGYSLQVPVVGLSLFDAIRLQEDFSGLVMVDANHDNVFYSATGRSKSQLLPVKKIPTKKEGLSVFEKVATKNVRLVSEIDVKKLLQALLSQRQSLSRKFVPVQPLYIVRPAITKSKKPKFF